MGVDEGQWEGELLNTALVVGAAVLERNVDADNVKLTDIETVALDDTELLDCVVRLCRVLKVLIALPVKMGEVSGVGEVEGLKEEESLGAPLGVAAEVLVGEGHAEAMEVEDKVIVAHAEAELLNVCGGVGTLLPEIRELALTHGEDSGVEEKAAEKVGRVAWADAVAQTVTVGVSLEVPDSVNGGEEEGVLQQEAE